MPKFHSKVARHIYNKITYNSTLTTPTIQYDGLSELVLNISQKCNLNCIYCFADHGHYGSSNNQQMSFNVAKNVIDAFLAKYGQIKSIRFFGGEPLLNFALIRKVCQYFNGLEQAGKIKKKPLFVIITNLTILSQEMIRFFYDNDIFVTVSIDGPKNVHDSFRKFENKKGSFDIVDKNTRILTGKIGVNLRIEAVYSPLHFKMGITMADLFDFLSERYNVNNILIHPLSDNKYFKSDSLIQNKKMFSRFSSEIYNYASEFGRRTVNAVADGKDVIEVCLFFKNIATKEHVDNHCGLGITKFTINADGKVYPCYTFINNTKFIAADFTRNKLSDNKFSRIQSKFLSNRKSSNNVCADCDLLITCKACPGMMFHKHKNINKAVSLLCDYYLGKTEGMLLGLNEISLKSRRWKNFLKNITRIMEIIDCP